jgi:hypothetical protein
MQNIKESFDYEFIASLNYIKKGEPVRAKKISIKAPTNRNIRELTILEKEFEQSSIKMVSMLSQSLGKDNFDNIINNRDEFQKKPKKKSESEEPKEQSIIKTLFSGGADIEKCFDILKKIFLNSSNTNPVALIDDTEKLTETIYNDFSYIDIKNILGLYLINFIISSQDF